MKRSVRQSLEDILLLAGLPLLVPVLYSLILKEDAWLPMLISVLALIMPGLPRALVDGYGTMRGKLAATLGDPSRPVSWKLQSLLELDLAETIKKRAGLTQSEAIAIAALCWILVPVITSVPYMMLGFSPTDSLFDSMSGWTATGLTNIDNPELLPRGFILFRSFTLWIGGAGIVLFALLVLGSPGNRKLLMAEGRENIAIGVRNTVKLIWAIYLALTLLGIGLFILTGLGLFNAVNIGMAAIATGGFLPSSLLVYTDAQKMVFILMMTAGATSFALFFDMWNKRFGSLLRHTEFKMMVFLIALFSVLLVMASRDTLIDAAFDVTAAVSGAGFTIRNLSIFSDLAKYSLLLLMISGGCSGSTTGALKLWRIFALAKTLGNKVRASFLPRGAVQVVKVNGRVLSAVQIEESGVFIFLYLFVLVAAAWIVMATGYRTIDSLFMVASAMGNVGMSTFNVYAAPLLVKWVLIVCMYVGRIEILPSLVMLNYFVRG